MEKIEVCKKKKIKCGEKEYILIVGTTKHKFCCLNGCKLELEDFNKWKNSKD